MSAKSAKPNLSAACGAWRNADGTNAHTMCTGDVALPAPHDVCECDCHDDDVVHCCDADEDLDYGNGYTGHVTCAGCGAEMEYMGDGTSETGNGREWWTPAAVPSSTVLHNDDVDVD